MSFFYRNFMKKIFPLLMIILAITAGCCAKHKAIKQTTVTVAAIGNTLGKVSHQYNGTGCASVIIVSKEGQQDMTLIPVEALPKEYDTDGLYIYFNYRTLKVKNPEGCSVGIPVQLTDISKK
jgi:hypothetical protein